MNAGTTTSALARVALAVAALLLAAGSARADVDPASRERRSDDPRPVFVLIDRDLAETRVRISALDAQRFRYQEADDAAALPRTMPRGEVLALVQERPGRVRRSPDDGLLRFQDGRRLPGSPASRVPAAPDRIVWSHPWLGPVEVALGEVASVILDASRPLPAAGAGDVVLLRNGDRVEGFIDRLGDPLVLETETDRGPARMEFALDRVASVRLVPTSGTSAIPRRTTRLWHADGTVADLPQAAIGDDGYLRIRLAGRSPGEAPMPLRLDDVHGLLFEPASVLPLAALDPIAVETDPLRFEATAPSRLDADAPLDLARVALQGPVVVRWRVPDGARRFAAVASLPPGSRDWGDCEIVVRSERREVLRARLDGAHPAATIAVSLDGPRLEIEIIAGPHGGIQDRVILERALLLLEVP